MMVKQCTWFFIVTCVPEENACAVSCKTEREARIEEVSQKKLSNPSKDFFYTLWKYFSMNKQ